MHLTSNNKFSPTAALPYAGYYAGKWGMDGLDRTCFTNSEGQVILAKEGDPVGLMLDTSKGAGYADGQFVGLGPELMSDPSFENGVGDFRDDSTGSGFVGHDSASEELILSHGGGFDHARATFLNTTSTQNKWLIVQLNDVAGDLSQTGFYNSSGVGIGLDRGIHTFIVPPNTSSVLFSVRVFNSGQTLRIGSISVRELPGRHFYQNEDDRRPILARDDWGRFHLRLDGVDDLMETEDWPFLSDFTTTFTIGEIRGNTNYPALVVGRGGGYLDPQQRQPMIYLLNLEGNPIKGRVNCSVGLSPDKAVVEASILDKPPFVGQVSLNGGQVSTGFNGTPALTAGAVSDPSPIADGGPDQMQLGDGQGSSFNFYSLSIADRALTETEKHNEYRLHASDLGLLNPVAGDWSDMSLSFHGDGYTTQSQQGDPVGLLLDTSQGAGYYDGEFTGLGPELVVGPSTNHGIATDNGDGTYTYDGSQGTIYLRWDDIGIKAGHWYVLEADFIGNTAQVKLNGESSVVVHSGNPALIQGGVLDGAQFIMFGQKTTTLLKFSVRELPGRHLSQDEADKRPTLQSAGGAMYLDFDGIDDRLETDWPFIREPGISWTGSFGSNKYADNLYLDIAYARGRTFKRLDTRQPLVQLFFDEATGDSRVGIFYGSEDGWPFDSGHSSLASDVINETVNTIQGTLEGQQMRFFGNGERKSVGSTGSPGDPSFLEDSGGEKQFILGYNNPSIEHKLHAVTMYKQPLSDEEMKAEYQRHYSKVNP